MGDSRGYWLGFSLVKGIGPARVRALLDAFGDIGVAWNANAQELRQMGLGQQLTETLIETRGRLDLEAELERIDRGGFGLLTWEDPAYPERLLEIDAPPPVLYVRGGISTKTDGRRRSSVRASRRDMVKMSHVRLPLPLPGTG